MPPKVDKGRERDRKGRGSETAIPFTTKTNGTKASKKPTPASPTADTRYGTSPENIEAERTARMAKPKKRHPPAKVQHHLPPIDILLGPRAAQQHLNGQRNVFPKPDHPKPRPGTTWQQEDGNMNEHIRLGKFSKGEHLSSTGSTNGDKRAQKNVLVARYENEDTSHLPGWRGRAKVPTVSELMGDIVELPVNVVEGPWDNVDEYLEAHYELLREDSFAPLRDAVGVMRVCPETDDNHDLCVYEQAKIIGFTFANMGVCVKFSFSTNRARKAIRWSQSKRLCPGTLVALSSDNFKSIIKIATVAARPISGVEKKPPEIDLIFEPNDIEIDPTQTWLIMEARSSYFEAYKHTLVALQRMNEQTSPLFKHLAYLNMNIGTPEYLKADPIMNLNHCFPDHPDRQGLYDVDVLRNWPSEGVTSSMDSTQIDALRRILTQNLAIVQGPPGTGKTYTSVLALKTMLKNMKTGDPPIIVACQTNHALDQMLGHIIAFEPEIIRLGGRTQDTGKIFERTMFNVRKSSAVYIRGQGATRKQLDITRRNIVKILKCLKPDLLSLDVLEANGGITAAQHRSFIKYAEEWIKPVDEGRPEHPMEAWLGEYLVPFRIRESMYQVYEEYDMDYEDLQELEAEFRGDDEYDGILRGDTFSLKRGFYVREPMGVTKNDIEEWRHEPDVYKIPEYVRPALYLHIEHSITKKLEAQLRSLNNNYQLFASEVKIAQLEKDAHLCSKVKLIGMTTTGLSKYRSLVAAIQPKAVLIEEAAETLEGPLIVSCLPTVEHLILVGDHKQLRGHCAVMELEGQPYCLGISMFERLVNNGMDYTVLSKQRRMRPEIREILGPIYPDLADDIQVLNKTDVAGMGGVNMYICAHTVQETNDEMSKANEHEAEMIAAFCDYLILNGQQGKNITILTFYSGQIRMISRKIRRNPHLFHERIRIATVDSYQGEENDIVLLSLVRSNQDGNIGFLSVQNRVCVALSRAQRGFYIFGNIHMITAVDKLWWDIANTCNRGVRRVGMALPLTCTKHKQVTYIEDLVDWLRISGGCQLPCGEQLDCGHPCSLTCHPFGHASVTCAQKCNKRMACGHICSLECHMDCICEECPAEAPVTISDSAKHLDIPQDVRSQYNMPPKPGHDKQAALSAQVKSVPATSPQTEQVLAAKLGKVGLQKLDKQIEMRYKAIDPKEQLIDIGSEAGDQLNSNDPDSKASLIDALIVDPNKTLILPPQRVSGSTNVNVGKKWDFEVNSNKETDDWGTVMKCDLMEW